MAVMNDIEKLFPSKLKIIKRQFKNLFISSLNVIDTEVVRKIFVRNIATILPHWMIQGFKDKIIMPAFCV
jgi:hypothetical protein